MKFERCNGCGISHDRRDIVELPSRHKLCNSCANKNKLPLRQGERLRDVRYGQILILAVEEKRVWFQRLRTKKPGKGIHHTSKRRAKEFLSEGPDWAEPPRWRLPEATLAV